tara:strand:- start:1480 stop:2424 length:945 start_codon:yes stop_codon:yes gene_type:complete
MSCQINFLWQDHSAYDNTTAQEVAKINPDKFIINVDGPGSDSSNPQCGPNVTQLVNFVKELVSNGFTGKLVMHPDATKGDYDHDWNGKGKLPKRSDQDAWMNYCDYFVEMNAALKHNKLPLFKEILIETESSYIPRTADSFNAITKYLRDAGQIACVSTTGDWNVDRKNLAVNCVYPQLYDMAYVSNLLRGENVPSISRAKAVAKGMVNIIKEKPAMLNDPNVYFTFSYAGDDTDAPVFGASGRVWNKNLFDTFVDDFKQNLSEYSSTDINTGVWHCSAALNAWKFSPFFSKHKKKIISGIILLGILLALLLNN